MVNEFSASRPSGPSLRSTVNAWPVGLLIRAIADNLESRFNPVTVTGELSSFSRAGSGHCYFSLKDDAGQIRCAMFRRAASLLDFQPRDGQLVELKGRLGIYEPRGELQLIAESLRQAGDGTLFEQFIALKNRLEAEGLFDQTRKRAIPLHPRRIGVVTSLSAAALHDVLTTLIRRAPHIPVMLYPASVQGPNSASQLSEALKTCYQRDEVDVVLLVRGGGAMEDLWSFNDEHLARTIVGAPIPVISGVGHETDFTIADFCADLRAPTPTAAAELCARPRVELLDALASRQARLVAMVERQLSAASQRVDVAASRLGRPSAFLNVQQSRLSSIAQNFLHARRAYLRQCQSVVETLGDKLPRSLDKALSRLQQRQKIAEIRLDTLNPQHVLKRGYAFLSDVHDRPITAADQTRHGQAVRATLADGQVDLTVAEPRLI